MQLLPGQPLLMKCPHQFRRPLELSLASRFRLVSLTFAL